MVKHNVMEIRRPEPRQSVDAVIHTRGLQKRFGRHLAVEDLSLQVPRGSVFAFLGKNGAGKTTTIRMLLNLLDKSAGEARILGLDSVRDALEIKRRIGFVADGQMMYDWMSVDEIGLVLQRLLPELGRRLCRRVAKTLELTGKQKVHHLSRGQQAKLALLLAMAHKPELLILDEPTTGLDVVVRRDFLEGIIELIQEEGRTVFFSSHIVHEVERVADWVGIIDKGRLICCSPLEELKAGVRRLTLTFAEPPAPISGVPHLLRCEPAGRQVALTVSHYSEATLDAVQALHPAQVEVADLSLEDIFVALVGHAEEE